MVSSISMGTAYSCLHQIHHGSAPKLALSLASHPKIFRSPTRFRTLYFNLIPESDSNSGSCPPDEYDYKHAAAGKPKVPKDPNYLSYDNPYLKSGNKNLFELEMDDEAAWLRMDMPGVSTEGLKVWFESNVLKITGLEVEAKVDETRIKKQGEGSQTPNENTDEGLNENTDEVIEKKKEGSEKELRKYYASIEIPEIDSLNKDKAVAKIRDGVLKLKIPKLQLEEKKGVTKVKIIS